MAISEISQAADEYKVVKIKENLLMECRVMVEYALANGKPLDPGQIASLHKEDKSVTSAELMPVYNYLTSVVKPAIPGTLVLFYKNKHSNHRFKFLGPLPIVRQFMLLSICSLLALILVSLSPDVNAHSIQLSMLQGKGLDQLQRLIFLLACASVGASFYALFKMNSYINLGTFNMKYSGTYWSRYVLGLVAGVLLSELFISFIDSQDNAVSASQSMDETNVLTTTNYLLKPILAILGGFSAGVVYRILNRLVEAVESVFKVSSSEAIRNVQQKLANEAMEKEQRIKSNMTHQVLELKNHLLNGGADEALLNKVDTTLEHLGGVTTNLSDQSIPGKPEQNPATGAS